MSLSDIKREARLAIHNEMAEPCLYSDGINPTVPTPEQTDAGLELTVRWHLKAKVLSSESDGLSIMENIEKVVFIQDQLDALEFEPEGGCTLYFPGYDASVTLDQQLDPDGPVQRYWTVTRA